MLVGDGPDSLLISAGWSVNHEVPSALRDGQPKLYQLLVRFDDR